MVVGVKVSEIVGVVVGDPLLRTVVEIGKIGTEVVLITGRAVEMVVRTAVESTSPFTELIVMGTTAATVVSMVVVKRNSRTIVEVDTF